MPRAFPTEAVISAAGGVLICKIDAVYEVCAYMAGEPVWTHQLPRVGREIEAALRRRHPDLAATLDEAQHQVTRDNWQEYRDRFIQRHGPTIELAPLSADQHESIDPVSEAAQMMPPDRIITVSK